MEFYYYNEEKNSVPVNYLNTKKQEYLFGTSIGVEWRSPMGKNISIIRKNKIVKICPLIEREYIIVSFTDFSSYNFLDNEVFLYDFNGNQIKKIIINRYNQEVIIDEDKLILSNGKMIAIRQEENVICTISSVISNGWGYIYRDIIFDEEQLDLSKIINLWRE